MPIKENIDLKNFNSFGIKALARYFSSFTSTEEALEILDTIEAKQHSTLILGGGSNILFTKDINGLVLKNEITFFELIEENEDTIVLQAGAGVNWHQLVMYCIQKGWGGLENLSLIPGCVGASPLQNIGAYGVEVKDVIEKVDALHLQDKTAVSFTNADCQFGYRESAFKNQWKGQFLITAVSFRLHKHPRLNTSYGAIEAELEKMQIKEPTIKSISDAVIQIRTSKLPDPKIIGNAGSFFKNPSIPTAQFSSLQKEFPKIVGYPNQQLDLVKIAAGWLIEQCGFKGYRKGDAGCHALQALVLVNYGNATGSEIFELSETIIVAVQEKFGIKLEREVNIW